MDLSLVPGPGLHLVQGLRLGTGRRIEEAGRQACVTAADELTYVDSLERYKAARAE
jgi:hypothetical protein